MPSGKIILLGGILLDRYFEVDRYPAIGQESLIHQSFDRIGGCCLNVAITLNNLGNQPYIISQYGDDEAGKEIIQYMKSLGISTTWMAKSPGGITGYCLNILDRTGERTFFTARGCEADFPDRIFSPEMLSDISFAFITGYYLLKRKTASAVLELTNRLHKSKCRILFDPGPLVAEMETTHLRDLLMMTDWMAPNVRELAIIQKKLGINRDLKGWFFRQGGQGIVLKKGSHGAEIFTPSMNFKHNGFLMKPIDTTGAGDSFVGGFIHGLIHGYSLPQTVAMACACGAITTTIKGPHGIFSVKDIAHILSSGGEISL